jgi:hypothetical protein
MKDLVITTEHCGNTYEHGKIITVRSDYSEATVQINAEFVICEGDQENLHNEIEEVIRRYAI